jgi:GDP-mannose 6-dehydrogenase
MKISIFGLGYVGTVTAACLARRGHQIIGVDIHRQKIEAFSRGVPPIVEPGLGEMMRAASAKGMLRATTCCEEAIRESELSLICVGTPSKADGALDLENVRDVTKQIAKALRQKVTPHAMVFRSTMLPGSTVTLVRECLEVFPGSGPIEVYFYPEFLRESTAVEDFENPSLIVVGTKDGLQPPAPLMKELFGLNAAVVDWSTAEMVKYACNAFHATKVAFANEVGRFSTQVHVDSRIVMDLLCRDLKLNLSPYYLKPGNPFGGSCLSKDVRALTHLARQRGLDLPLVESVLPSNARHLENLLGLIAEAGQDEVAILGLSFKSNTDDLRESAMVEVSQTLLGRGYKLRIYDPALNLSALVGANKRVIDTRMPHLASLLCSDLASAIGQRGLVVAAQKCASLTELKQVVTPDHVVLDVNSWPELKELPSRYVGFCW